MNTKATKAEREQAAIEAGYWFAKAGGGHKNLWRVGRGTGCDAVTLTTAHVGKAAARAAMVAAWEASL